MKTKLFVLILATLFYSNSFAFSPNIKWWKNLTEEKVREIIDNNAVNNIFLRKKIGLTPLHIVVINKKVPRIDRIKFINMMVKAGADINKKTNSGRSPIHYASELSILESLLNAGANVNIQTNKGRTPLHLAAAYGKSKNVNALLKYGANVNVKDKNGYIPLHDAVINKKNSKEVINVISTLINHNANVNTQNKKGDTPLHELVFCSNIKFNSACSKDTNEKVIELLLDNGADITNIKNIKGLSVEKYAEEIYEFNRVSKILDKKLVNYSNKINKILDKYFIKSSQNSQNNYETYYPLDNCLSWKVDDPVSAYTPGYVNFKNNCSFPIVTWLCVDKTGRPHECDSEANYGSDHINHFQITLFAEPHQVARGFNHIQGGDYFDHVSCGDKSKAVDKRHNVPNTTYDKATGKGGYWTLNSNKAYQKQYGCRYVYY